MVQWHWSSTPDASWHTDRGLAYGDGVFETIAVMQRGPVLQERHRDRLVAGCRFLGIPFTADDWKAWWSELSDRGWLHAENQSGHVIKLIVSRGSGGRGYATPDVARPRAVCIRSAMPEMPRGSVRLNGAQIPVAPCPSGLGLKTLNRLDQVIAARYMAEGCFDTLMSDHHGRPVEGSRSNLFILRGRVLQTPPLRSLAVAGVMRGALLAGAPRLGLRAIERPVTWDALRRGDAVFLTNSLVGAVQVGQIGCLSLPDHNALAEIRSFIRQELGV